MLLQRPARIINAKNWANDFMFGIRFETYFCYGRIVYLCSNVYTDDHSSSGSSSAVCFGLPFNLWTLKLTSQRLYAHMHVLCVLTVHQYANVAVYRHRLDTRAKLWWMPTAKHYIFIPPTKGWKNFMFI